MTWLNTWKTNCYPQTWSHDFSASISSLSGFTLELKAPIKPRIIYTYITKSLRLQSKQREREIAGSRFALVAFVTHDLRDRHTGFLFFLAFFMFSLNSVADKPNWPLLFCLCNGSVEKIEARFFLCFLSWKCCVSEPGPCTKRTRPYNGISRSLGLLYTSNG